MRTEYIESFDKKKLYVSIWDEVQNPKGAVLIAHGMAEHSGRYADFAGFLNEAGYIVIAADERGHRFSADSNGVTDGDSYGDTIKDTQLLVEHIGRVYNLRVFLLGHSYGSFIAQGFLEYTAGKSIVGCILSGTAYMKNILTACGRMVAVIQNRLFDHKKAANLLNTLSFGAYDKPFKSEGRKMGWLSRDVGQVEKYLADDDCGYVMSIGFYYSFFNGLNGLYGAAAEKIDRNLPILIAVGSDDPVSRAAKDATKLYEFYKKQGLSVACKIYDGARHEILNEINNAEVYVDFLAFIKAAFGEEQS